MRRRRGSSGVSGRCCCDRTDRLPANTLQSDETCWVCTLTSSRLWVRRLLPNIHPAFLPSSPFTATRWEVEQLVSTSTRKTLWVNRVTNTNLVRRTRRSPPTINFNFSDETFLLPKFTRDTFCSHSSQVSQDWRLFCHGRKLVSLQDQIQVKHEVFIYFIELLKSSWMTTFMCFCSEPTQISLLDYLLTLFIIVSNSTSGVMLMLS